MKLSKTLFLSILLTLFSLFLNFYKIDSLNIGGDEAIYLSASKTLAEKGVYGIETNYGFLPYWQKIRTGPTLIVPLALIFKTAGFNPWVARYFQSTLTLIFLGLLYFLTKKIYDEKTALLAVFLINLSFWLPIEDRGVYTPINRYVNGEILALIFLLGFILAFRSYLEKPTTKHLVISGILIGLAGLTKLHFLIVLVPALLILGTGKSKNRFWSRPKGLPRMTILILSGLLPLVLWLLWSGGHHEGGLWGYLNLFFEFEGKPFTASVIKYSQNFYGIFQITPNTLEPVLSFPMLSWTIFGLWTGRDKKEKAIKIMLLTIIFVWILWYIISVGYPRYLLPGILLANIFIANGFVKLIADSKTKYYFLILFILVVGPALQFTLKSVLRTNETYWVNNLKNYLSKNIPNESKLELKDFELFELGKSYSIRFTPLKVRDYDQVLEGYNYIVGGFWDDYSRYENTFSKHKWEEVYSEGNYKVYRLEGDK